MKKAARSIVGLALAGLDIVFYLWFTPGRTRAIHQPSSIASLERIRIGDVDQYVLIRGNENHISGVFVSQQKTLPVRNYAAAERSTASAGFPYCPFARRIRAVSTFLDH